MDTLLAVIAVVLAVVAVLLAAMAVLRKPQRPVVNFYEGRGVDKELTFCQFWPLTRLDDIKALDAVPGVLVCLGGDEQRRWIRENLNEWFTVRLTEGPARETGVK
jgi:hypothetical protein